MADLISSLTKVMQAEINGLDVIAQNTANVNTPGYKSQISQLEGTQFLDRLSQQGTAEVKTAVKTQAGSFNVTGNNLDFALNGNAWFTVQHGEEIALTRNGNFRH